MVAAGHLEKPDAHAEPRHDLPHALLQHEGRRADGARDSAGRREGSITGSIDDAWQTALEDVGPAGVDKGKGGKYLILPPGYKDKVPDGYIALPSDTYTGFAMLRSNLKSGSDADIAKAVAYGKRIKFYPLVAGGESARDEVRRCDRRRVRQHDPLRPALLPDARPLRAARAVARARQGHDRSRSRRSASRRASRSTPTRRRRRFSTTPRAKRMPGSISSTRASSRRRSTRARTGRCRPRRMSPKG